MHDDTKVLINHRLCSAEEQYIRSEEFLKTISKYLEEKIEV